MPTNSTNTDITVNKPGKIINCVYNYYNGTLLMYSYLPVYNSPSQEYC